MGSNNFIKYGPQGRNVNGQEYVCATGQYFSRLGGHFVTRAGDGVKLVDTNASPILGWAETPKHDAYKDAWKSSATDGAGRDKVFVITGRNVVYAMPALESTASLNASLIGDAAELTINSTATYATIQSVLLGASTTNQVVIEDVDLVNRIVYVRINTFEND